MDITTSVYVNDNVFILKSGGPNFVNLEKLFPNNPLLKDDQIES